LHEDQAICKSVLLSKPLHISVQKIYLLMCHTEQNITDQMHEHCLRTFSDKDC